MSQDIVADALNKIMNAQRARKETVSISYHSKLLNSILAIAKLRGYIKNYQTEGTKLTITLGNLHGIGPIKPRFMVEVKEIDEYVRMYLPSRNIGILIVSTSQGLMTHSTAIEKNIGGSLIAFMF